MAKQSVWTWQGWPARPPPQRFGSDPCPGLKREAAWWGSASCKTRPSDSGCLKTCRGSSPGQIHSLLIFPPLRGAWCVPDVVVVEDEVEKLMWINLAYLHATGGRRIQSSTAILQATCVDAAIVPYLEQRLNFSYGCYGCRDATDLAASETVVGFPICTCCPRIVQHLQFLAQKAIPTSRGKKAWRALKADKQRSSG